MGGGDQMRGGRVPEEEPGPPPPPPPFSVSLRLEGHGPQRNRKPLGCAEDTCDSEVSSRPQENTGYRAGKTASAGGLMPLSGPP